MRPVFTLTNPVVEGVALDVVACFVSTLLGIVQPKPSAGHSACVSRLKKAKGYSSAPSARAFSLIEVVLALGISTFCLMTLLGLFSLGIGTSKTSEQELQAAHLSQSILDSRRSAPTATLVNHPLPVLNATTTSQDNLSSPSKINDQGELTTGTDAKYGVLYQVIAPPSGEKKPFKIYLCLYWPPNAAKGNWDGRYELITCFAGP